LYNVLAIMNVFKKGKKHKGKKHNLFCSKPKRGISEKAYRKET
jgi:hypothetical protein